MEGGLLPQRDLLGFYLKLVKRGGLIVTEPIHKGRTQLGTVHSIIKREYEPSLYSLNRLADFLGVRRQYLWKLAGLLEGRV